MLNFNDIVKLNMVICSNNNQKSLAINQDNLKSALGIQQWYDDLEFRACALFRSLIIAHGFQDGNKRTAALALVSLITPKVSQELIADTAIKVANGDLKDINDIHKILFQLEVI